MSDLQEITVCRFADLDDPGCREFTIGEGDWPFRGFVVRRGENVYAYQNVCAHAGHPLNLGPDRFLTPDGGLIICSSHGAQFDIDTGECAGGPCRGKALRSLPCEVRNGEVRVTGPASA